MVNQPLVTTRSVRKKMGNSIHDTNTSSKNVNRDLLVYEEPATQTDQPLRYRVKAIWGILIQSINRSSKLQIWQSFDCDGYTIWHGYNPRTGESAVRSSEAELIDWIEESYYR
jgi:hypothetical protein